MRITKTLMTALAGAGALALGACGTTSAPLSDDDIAEALPNYERTGETETCLSVVRIDEIDPVTDRLWLVETRGGEVYLNQVSPGCNGAASTFTYLSYEIPGTQLCRGEIIRVVEQTSDITRGSCGLGEYERLIPTGQ